MYLTYRVQTQISVNQNLVKIEQIFVSLFLLCTYQFAFQTCVELTSQKQICPKRWAIFTVLCWEVDTPESLLYEVKNQIGNQEQQLAPHEIVYIDLHIWYNSVRGVK